MIKLNNYDHGKGFDFGQISDVYAKYRDIYPEQFYKTIVENGFCRDGQRVLDLGTGTGVIPRNMYKYNAKWTGTDLSENQIFYAKKLAKENDMNIDFIVSPAEKLPFVDNTFDVVTACQCFMYFDRKKVLPEVNRVLKPDGHFLIMYMAYLPLESEIALGSEKIILKYNPQWTGGNWKRKDTVSVDFNEPYYKLNHCYNFYDDVTFTRESWHGRIMSCRGVGASSLTNEQIAEFDREHKQFLEQFDKQFTIPHYSTIIDLVTTK